MVYKVFDKKAADSGIKSMQQNEHLAEEIHKPIIRKFRKRRMYSTFKDHIWAADLADKQLISKFSKRFRFLLCVIKSFSKYAWVVPLKDKKVVSIVNAFQSISKDSNKKTNKIWVNKAVSSITILLKNGYKTVILLCIQHILKENVLFLKDLLEP